MNPIAVAVAVGTPLFVMFFFMLFFHLDSEQHEPYLKRVAKKYSIRPLDLR